MLYSRIFDASLSQTSSLQLWPNRSAPNYIEDDHKALEDIEWGDMLDEISAFIKAVPYTWDGDGHGKQSMMQGVNEQYVSTEIS